MTPFDYINSISFNKNDLMGGTGNDELAEKDYPAFIVNKGLSYYIDTILHSNEMNQRPSIDNRLQYTYLLNSIRAHKRFAKWAKREDSNDLDAVKEYYGYNNEKAFQALSLLSPEQLSMIKEQLQKGGLNEHSRKPNRGEVKKRG